VLDLDELEDKPDKISLILTKVREGFTEKGKDGATIAMAKASSEIKSLNPVEWIQVKAETKELHTMTGKELTSLRKKVAVVAGNGWEADLDMDSNGVVKGGLKNCNIILKDQPHIKGKLRFNDFLKRPCITGDVPFLPRISIGDGEWKELDKDALSQLRSWLAMDQAEFGRDCLNDAIVTVALNDVFNPLTEILDGCLASWDKKPRLDNWLFDLCEAEKGSAEYEEYVRQASSKWMISAVARAYEAGCKVDTMLILEGIQGAGKSSFLRELSFGYFLELITDISKGKDVIDKMLGKWIIEMPELKALSGDREANKAFLTQQIDHERLSYDPRSSCFPRRCVFIGTTNESTYLKDDSGERRYWPVKVGKCDSVALKTVLLQLWGEAVSRYKAGEKWWFEDEAVINASQEIQNSKSESDDMEIEVDNFLELCTEPFGSLEVWKSVFHGKEENFTKSIQMRVAKILRKSGCVRNKTTKQWSKS
tara:strand:+ start:1452 stop:2891 length:1440 start_codon:yes stop_codon:yes gene_type:complete